MRLYSMPLSGNSHKVRLLLALTGREIDIIDVPAGSAALTDAKASGALPFGRAPALDLGDGRVLAESNAILWYLGEGTGFVPADPVDRAQMLSWMFWEQYSHEPVIAVRGALRRYPERAAEATPDRMADLLARGHAVLAVMERGLAGRDWLVGAHPTLADVALYGYTHSAGTLGGFEMAGFPRINAWIGRVASLPGHRGIDA